jgi:hypothetical protein
VEARGICLRHLNAKNGIATDEFVKEKAQELGGQMAILDLMDSSGWLHHFKWHHR